MGTFREMAFQIGEYHIVPQPNEGFNSWLTDWSRPMLADFLYILYVHLTHLYRGLNMLTTVSVRYVTERYMFDSQILTGEDWNEVMYDGIVSQGGHR